MCQRLILIACSASMLMGTGCSTTDTAYAYRPLFEEYGGFAVDPSRQIVDYGHVILEITECGLSEKFACVSGGGLDFAIPRRQSGGLLEDVWEFGDYRYEVAGRFEGTVLGEKSSFFIIEQTPIAESLKGARVKRFVYEFNRGVVATGLIIKERNTTQGSEVMLPDMRDVLVLKGSRGLAAQDH